MDDDGVFVYVDGVPVYVITYFTGTFPCLCIIYKKNGKPTEKGTKLKQYKLSLPQSTSYPRDTRVPLLNSKLSL